MKTVQQIRSRITHLENRNKELKNLDSTITVLELCAEYVEHNLDAENYLREIIVE